MNFDDIDGVIGKVFTSSALNRGFDSRRVKPTTIKLVRVMVFNATFNNISDNCGGQFYWWRKSKCRKSLTNFITQYCIEYTSP